MYGARVFAGAAADLNLGPAFLAAEAQQRPVVHDLDPTTSIQCVVFVDI